MTFSSLSLSHSPATNFTRHARESDQRRRGRQAVLLHAAHHAAPMGAGLM